MESEQDDAALEVTQPTALEAMERAQIDVQISTAKRYPRPALKEIKRRMLEFATLDEETAEACFYTLKRKDWKTGKVKIIQGPSVRLAEIAVVCYGNVRAGARIVGNDGRAITSQGMCHDLENNSLVSMEVRRRITSHAGRTYDDDMQVVTGNAANAISFRNAVLKVIPGALTRPVYDAARSVAIGTSSTLAAKRDKIIKRLEAMGATVEAVLVAVEKATLDEIGLKELEILIGLGTSIKDGDTTVEEAFPEKRPEIALPTLGADAVKPSASQERKAQPEKPEPEKPEPPKAGPKAAEAEKPEQPEQETPKAEPQQKGGKGGKASKAGKPEAEPELPLIPEVSGLPDAFSSKYPVLRCRGKFWTPNEDYSSWEEITELQALEVASRPAKGLTTDAERERK